MDLLKRTRTAQSTLVDSRFVWFLNVNNLIFTRLYQRIGVESDTFYPEADGSFPYDFANCLYFRQQLCVLFVLSHIPCRLVSSCQETPHDTMIK